MVVVMIHVMVTILMQTSWLNWLMMVNDIIQSTINMVKGKYYYWLMVNEQSDVFTSGYCQWCHRFLVNHTSSADLYALYILRTILVLVKTALIFIIHPHYNDYCHQLSTPITAIVQYISIIVVCYTSTNYQSDLL